MLRTTVGFAVVAILMMRCSASEQKTAPAPVKVSVLEIKQRDAHEQLSYSGTIEPDNTAQIGFAVSGVINTIAVQEGQPVKQGQFLAGIDATEYSEALAIATASLDQAQDLHKRLSALYEKGSLPAKDYIEIKTRLAQAQANKHINAKHIADSRLYAPMTGIVTARLIERGSMAAPGAPAFTIVKTDQVYARISVPESEIGALKKDMTARVYIATLRDTVAGKITIINPVADATSNTYSVKIRIANLTRRLLPGMIATVIIHTDRPVPLMTVPATAVVRDANDVTYLFLRSESNTALRKRVTVTGIAGDNEVVVTGLENGDQVITAGMSRLKDGSAIAL
jgi:RND family efflux transporter MFP subunit